MSSRVIMSAALVALMALVCSPLASAQQPPPPLRLDWAGNGFLTCEGDTAYVVDGTVQYHIAGLDGARWIAHGSGLGLETGDAYSLIHVQSDVPGGESEHYILRNETTGVVTIYQIVRIQGEYIVYQEC